MSERRSLVSIGSCAACALLSWSSVTAHAQNPTTNETDDLKKELARMEQRVNELEARNRSLAVEASASTAPQGGATPAVAEESLKWKDLISEGNKFRLYGFLRLDVQYDDSRPNNPQTIGWILSEDPAAPPGIGAGGKNKENLTIHPRLTRFGLDFDGGTVGSLRNAKITGKVEVDFYNNGLAGQSESREALRMRHAYLKLAWGDFSLLAGQTVDVISPLYPIVNADLAMWGAGNLGDRRPQLRTEYMTGGDMKWIFQAEAGLTGADDNQDLDAAGTFGAGVRDGESSGLPTLQARVAVRFPIQKQNTEIGIWVDRAWEEPDTSFNGENDFDSDALGFDVSLPLPVFGDRLSLKAEAWDGKNLDDVRGGIFQGINKTTGDEIDAHGGFVELGCKTTDHNTLYVGWSNDDPKNSDVGSQGRAENQIWYFASRWNYKPVAIGFEYLNWTTKYVNLGDGTDNRFAGFISYAF